MRMPVSMSVTIVTICLSSLSATSWAGAQQPSPAPQTAPRDRRPTPPRATASIRGRVVDGVTGQPIARVEMRISARSNGGALKTDDAGMFAFTNLPAGRYTLYAEKSTYLRATYPETGRSLRAQTQRATIEVADGASVDNVTMSMFHGGAITGRLVDAHGDLVENVSIQAKLVSRGGRSPRGDGGEGSSNEVGEFRIGRLDSGSYILMAVPRNTAADGSTLVPTFYPGVLNPEQAQPVAVQRGQTISDIEFPLIEQPVTVVKGTVIDDHGKAATGGHVSVESTVGPWSNWSGGTRIEDDGTFALRLPPGDYQLNAYIPTAPKPAGAVADRVSRSDQPEARFGVARLSVGAESTANVVIIAGEGSTISGRLVFAGDGKPPDPAQIEIKAQPMYAMTLPVSEGLGENPCHTNSRAHVNADLTFAIEGVQGTCVLNAIVRGGQWRVRSAAYQSVDLLDRPIELRNNQQVRGVEIVFSDRHATLTAEVTDDQDAASRDYVLIAFSADRARWTNARYSAFFVPSSAPRPTPSPSAPAPAPVPVSAPPAGRTIIASRPQSPTLSWLPPGDYYVAALDDANAEEVRDPAFFESLTPSATRVTLHEGEAQTVSLHRIKPPAGPAQ